MCDVPSQQEGCGFEHKHEVHIFYKILSSQSLCGWILSFFSLDLQLPRREKLMSSPGLRTERQRQRQRYKCSNSTSGYITQFYLHQLGWSSKFVAPFAQPLNGGNIGCFVVLLSCLKPTADVLTKLINSVVVKTTLIETKTWPRPECARQDQNFKGLRPLNNFPLISRWR